MSSPKPARRAHLPRFQIAAPVPVGAVVDLDGAELRHARVRRLAVGEAVALFDGAGFACVARIEHVGRAALRARVEALRPPREAESPLALTLAVALPKGDTLEWVIEKATELGVSAIQPFSSTHTLAAPSAARQARWQHIARAAAKQCGRSVVPAVAAPLAFGAVLHLPGEVRLLFAERDAAHRLADIAPPTAPAGALLVVGPEGGFADAELAAAAAAGFHLVGLGPRILRADTAAIAATALCQARWGDAG